MQVVSTLSAGEYFGQQALWKTNTPRAATVVTKTTCTFYTLERSLFQSILGPLDQIWRFQALQKVRALLIRGTTGLGAG
jgi:CRP-like cAMP-binding protein